MTTTTQANPNTLTLTGRLDAHQAPMLKRWFQERAHASKLIISLQGVRFIDASGLNTLKQGMEQCRRNGGDLYLCHVQQAVQIIFEIVKLAETFHVLDHSPEKMDVLTI